MARAWKCHGLRPLPARLAFRRPGAHPPLPVRVIAVGDEQCEWCPERPSVPQAGEHLHPVLLELLARASAVALLPSCEVGVDRAAVEHEPGREAGQDSHQGRTVRLTCGSKPERHGSKPTARRITSTGADTP